MNELKKYEFTDETTEAKGVFNYVVLHRIRALKDFGDVRKGDLGGWVESEENLSHSDNAWVYNHAAVYGNAVIFGNARVYDYARVYGNARVYDYAEIFGNARVYDYAEIFGNAVVCDYAEITKATDILTISPIGRRNDTTTFYRSKNNKIFVKCGCKNTDIDTWLAMVEETHGNNKHGQAYRLAAQIAKLQIKLTEESE